MTRDRKRILSEYLVISAQGGDRAAFARLVRLWQADLLRHAVRLADEREAGLDALQDAWLDIVRGLPRLTEAAAFPAWAYRIVSRKCARSIRGKQAGRATIRALTDENRDASVDGVGEAERAADTGAIRLAMADLPHDQRLALALYHQDGLSVAEIAVITETPAGTVKTRLMHARRKLAVVLNPTQA